MFQKMPRKIFPPCQLIFRSLDAVVGLTAFEEATVLFSVGSNAEKKQYSNEPVKGLVAYVNGEVGQGNKIVFIELVSITASCTKCDALMSLQDRVCILVQGEMVHENYLTPGTRISVKGLKKGTIAPSVLTAPIIPIETYAITNYFVYEVG